MDVISDQEAIEALARHFKPFLEVMGGGWSDYQGLAPGLRATFTTTTRAGIVHDFQVARASSYAAQHGSQIRIAESSKLRLIVIADRYAIRLKKLDEALMPSNHITDQVRDFRGQRQIPGLPESCNLELGYVLNRSETDIEQVCLVFPNGPYRNLWAIDLLKMQAVTSQAVLNFGEHKAPEQPEKDESAEVIGKREGVVIPLKRETEKE